MSDSAKFIKEAGKLKESWGKMRESLADREERVRVDEYRLIMLYAIFESYVNKKTNAKGSLKVKMDSIGFDWESLSLVDDYEKRGDILHNFNWWPPKFSSSILDEEFFKNVTRILKDSIELLNN